MCAEFLEQLTQPDSLTDQISTASPRLPIWSRTADPMTPVTFPSRSNKLTRDERDYSTYSSATVACPSLTSLRPDTSRCLTEMVCGSPTTARSLTTSNCGMN